MANLINHLKKGESLSDMQLFVVNSVGKDDFTQNSSSFTYTFNSSPERISRADIVYVKIPKTFYNVNNDGASMAITTQIPGFRQDSRANSDSLLRRCR